MRNYCLKMLENHYRYPVIFDADARVQMTCIAIKSSQTQWKRSCLEADQNLLDCSEEVTEYQRGFTSLIRGFTRRGVARSLSMDLLRKQESCISK